MKGKSRNIDRSKDRPVLFVEVGLKQTKILEGTVRGHAQIATGLWMEEAWLCEEAGDIKIIPKNINTFLANFPAPGEVAIVIDPSVSSRFVHNVPLTTQDSIHEHLRLAVAKSERIDLVTHFWTATPLGLPQVNEKDFTAATFQERTAVLSATKKAWIDDLKVQLECAGWKVDLVLFQQACVIRAFQLFGGSALAKETVGLLHFSHSRYSLALLQNGIWVSHRDAQARGNSKLREDIKTYLASTLSHFRIKARCLFVSLDGPGAELLANDLKDGGLYSRTWNVLRKITVELKPGGQENILAQGAQFNALVGAMLIKADCAQPDSESEEIPASQRFLESCDRLLAVPLKIAACLAVIGSGYLWYLNSDAEAKQMRLATHLKQKEEQIQRHRAAMESPEQRLAALEMFRSSRKFWPGVVSQIRSLNIEGVSLSQVKITDHLSSPEQNPFETEPEENARWQNSGSMIVEARNKAGIGALEDFMNAIKANGYIKPLLHRKKPARVLNNIEITDEVAPATLFTVEYPLQDKTL